MFPPKAAKPLRFFEQGVDGVGTDLKGAADADQGRLLQSRPCDHRRLFLAQSARLGMRGERAAAPMAIQPLAALFGETIATNSLTFPARGALHDDVDHAVNLGSDTLSEKIPLYKVEP